MKIKKNKNITRLLTGFIFGVVLLGNGLLSADPVDGSITSCLKAWVTHPFGKNPQYKTLGDLCKTTVIVWTNCKKPSPDS